MVGIARSLKISRTNTIGLIMPSIESAFWPPVARAAEQELRERGYRLYVANTDEVAAASDSAIEMFLQTRVDGAIAAPPGGARQWPYQAYVRSGRPLVFLERFIPDVDADRVLVDDMQGGYLAAHHLVGLGHAFIGLISMPLELSASARWVDGIRQALHQASLTPPYNLLEVANFTQQESFAATRRLLERQPRPSAIIACSMRLTIGALAALHAAHVQVPEDVALVGYDEMPWAALCAPPLTVVQQPAREMGRIAAALLLSRLDGTRSTGYVTEVLQPRLLVRQSCGAPSSGTPTFAEFETGNF